MTITDINNKPVAVGQPVKFRCYHNGRLINGTGQIAAIDLRLHSVTIATGINRLRYGRGGNTVGQDDKVTVTACYDFDHDRAPTMKLLRDTEFYKTPVYVEIME